MSKLVKLPPVPAPFADERSEPQNSGDLGNYTKFAAPPYFSGFQADWGEVVVTRFAMLSQARKALPKTRTFSCLRYQRKGLDAQIWEDKETSKPHYRGLTVCGSVWSCPVCSAKVSAYRRSELKSGLDYFFENYPNGQTFLLTFTVPHYSSSDIDDIKTRLNSSWRSFTKSKPYSKFMKKIGYFGSIRTFEVTYSSNGFHPHIHFLLFLIPSKRVGPYFIEEFLRYFWISQCMSNGFSFKKCSHALDVRDASFCADYVSKWGLEHELTVTHSKEGKNGSLTPWDFLRLALDGDSKYLRLFRIYALSFKGQRQLVWSRGLKDKLLVDFADLSDLEIAEGVGNDSKFVYAFDKTEWRAIRYFSAFGHILRLSYLNKHQMFLQLDSLVQQYRLLNPDNDENFDSEAFFKNTTV